MREMLQERHDSDTALIHGSTRSYPGSTNTSPLDPMASVLGDDFDGANRRARDPPGPPVCLWSTDSWKRKYLEQLDQEGFHAQFDDLRRMRFKFLIIHGESCMGKTQFAKWATGGQNPWSVEGGFFLRGYNERLHDVIIFNDVADIDKIIEQYKVLFQCAETLVTIRASQTNWRAEQVRAWRKKIIITLNTETPEYQRMTTNRWIQHNAIICTRPTPF